MSVPAADNSDVEFTVTHAIAEAAARDGVRLPEGHRVRLTLVADNPPPRRVLPFIGMADSGKGDLGTRAKDIVRTEMGRLTE